MKKFFLLFFLAAALHSRAQASFSLYGQTALYKGDQLPNNYGINIFSPGIPLTGESGKKQTELRLGADFDFFLMDQRKMEHIPLAVPQVGNATVKLGNRLSRFNFITRFSFPYEKSVVPYFDLFAGVRNYSTMMSVDPNDTLYAPSSDKIYKAKAFNYGANAGVMLSLGNTIKLDAGFSFSCLGRPIKEVDMWSAHVENNSLVIDRKKAKFGLPMVHVGVVIMCNEQFGEVMSAIGGCMAGAVAGCFSGISCGGFFSGRSGDSSSSDDNTSSPQPKPKAKVNVEVK